MSTAVMLMSFDPGALLLGTCPIGKHKLEQGYISRATHYYVTYYTKAKQNKTKQHKTHWKQDLYQQGMDEVYYGASM